MINNLGLCILCEPNRGKLPGHSDKIVTVTIYNDICGSFSDTLMCEIVGLQPKTLNT